MRRPRDLDARGARALVRRAVDKAEQLGLRGGIAVVGASGALVTALPDGRRRRRRHGPGPLQGLDLGDPADPQHRAPAPHDASLPPPISAGFVARLAGGGCSPARAACRCATRTARSSAGIAASGATVSPFLPAGRRARGGQRRRASRPTPRTCSSPTRSGMRTSASTATTGPAGRRRFGAWRVDRGASLGMKPAPPRAARRPSSTWARELCDAVLARPRARPPAVSVAVVDRRRRADPAGPDGRRPRPAGSTSRAAIAAAAARFGGPSERRSPSGTARGRPPAALYPTPVLARARRAAGPADGRVVGGLGVGGAAPSVCAELARRGAGMSVRDRCASPSLGCGAIGSLYAAHLARVDGVEVWAVDPWREHVEAIDGAVVCGSPARADFVAPVHARTTAADLPPCDLGIVATKAMHTRAAVAAAPTVLADAAVASVQNGLGNEEVDRRAAAAGHPRHDRHRRRGHRRRASCATTRRVTPGSGRSSRARPGRTRSLLAGPAADAGGLTTPRDGRRPRSAVDEGRVQRGDQPAGRADRADRGPGLHRPGAAARRSTR